MKIYKFFIFIALICLLVVSFLPLIDGNFSSEISTYYIDSGIEDTGAINLVTAILFDYRGFDTLVEATVILAAAATIAFLIPKKRVPMLTAKFTIIVYQTISFVGPVLAILGMYLIFFGHLSPGGGFTGGVVLATIPILFTITYGISMEERRFSSSSKSFIESSGAFIFVFLGLLGIVAGSTFLASGRAGFPLGEPGGLISAGLLPYLNLAVGLKVGAGLALIFNSLIKED
ncbi:MAG: hydrogen gas-evolving membrane-bound hydrogenase subunit E [Halanaerobiaceae bacterium]